MTASLPIYKALFLGALLAPALLLEVILLARRSAVANQLLALLVACMALLGLEMVLIDVRAIPIPRFLLFPSPVGLLIGPLLWMHTEWLTRRDTEWDRYWLVHLIPSAAAAIFLVWVGIDTGRTQRYLQSAYDYGPRWWFNLAAIVSVTLYTVRVSRLLRECRARIGGRCSQNQTLTLAWLAYLVRVFGLLAVFFFFAAAAAYPPTIRFGSLIAFCAAVWAIAAFALRLSRLFDVAATRGSVNDTKYQTSPLDVARLSRIKEEVESYLAESKSFLEPNLSLADLASRLKMPPHYLSQVLSTEFGKGFYELIADYRVDQAKALLKDPAQMKRTVLEIAYDSGFNSKSVFNEAFRRRTGMTPRQFRAHDAQMS